MIEIPIFLIIAALGVLLLFSKDLNANRIILFVVLISLILIGVTYRHFIDNNVIKYLYLNIKMIHIESVNFFFILSFILTLVIGIIFYLSLESNKFNHLEIGTILIYGSIGITLVASNDILVVVILFEIMSILATIIILLNNNKAINTKKTAIEYIATTFIGGLFLFVGAISYTNTFHSTEIINISNLKHISKYFILIGLLIHLGFPPFSSWLVNGYSKCSQNASIFLSVFTTKAALLILIKMFLGYKILAYFGIILSMYGIIGSLFTPSLRKVLAYALIHQLGFMIISISNYSVESYVGISIYILTHILYETCFFIIAAILNTSLNHDKFYEMQGIFNKQHLIGFLLIFASLNSLGFPFTGGFISKVLIINSVGHFSEHYIYYFTILSAAAHSLHVGFKLPYLLYIKPQDVKKHGHLPKIKINQFAIFSIIIALVSTEAIYIYYSIKLSNINSLSNIYHEVTILVISLVMFAFLLEVAKPKKEYIIDGFNNILPFLASKIIKLNNHHLDDLYKKIIHFTYKKIIDYSHKSMVFTNMYYVSLVLFISMLIFIVFSLLIIF